VRPITQQRIEGRLRRAMSDGLPITARDIMLRLTSQISTTGLRYLSEPTLNQITMVMKRMPDITWDATGHVRLWALEVKEGEENVICS